jgi:hypothetical protein
MKKTFQLVMLLCITISACKKTESNLLPEIKFKEDLVKSVDVLPDSYTIIPLTDNHDGTFSGSLYSAELLFTGITYALYDEAGLPIPDRTGDPFMATVSMDPSNTVGANIVQSNGDNKFTIFFSGYLSGGCNATPTSLSFDWPSYSGAEMDYDDKYATLIDEYIIRANAWLADTTLPKPVYPLKSAPPALKTYFLGPICGESHTYSLDLIRLQGGGLGMRIKQ